jgi:hypothetical protein
LGSKFLVSFSHNCLPSSSAWDDEIVKPD